MITSSVPKGMTHPKEGMCDPWVVTHYAEARILNDIFLCFFFQTADLIFGKIFSHILVMGTCSTLINW